jgi:diguanylate cyclase (GGDEF)-like protein
MTVYLSAQLDFIFFLYGLAFILLGGVCFAIVGVPGRPTAFAVLGLFAVAHGATEWLDLIALLVGGTPAFAAARTVLMAGSFMLLLEFARRQALQLNDNHGHQVGDAVLVKLSKFVPQRIRPSDLLARWGGEEFIILAPGSDGQMAYQAAERLRVALLQAVFDNVGALSCSFGVSQHRDGDTAATILARADAALYRAKIEGRHRVELAARAQIRARDRRSR